MEEFARDKHSRLLLKFLRYEQKGFLTLAPGNNVVIYDFLLGYLLLFHSNYQGITMKWQ